MDAYWIPGALIAASLLLGIGITIFPQTAGAFWPFTVLSAAEPEAPIIHDTSIDLLEAATNPDPSPAVITSDIPTSEGAALMANAGVDGTIPEADHNGATVGGSISTYTVQPGDSISEIASSHGVSVDTILWANGLTRKSAIKPGMTLVILPVSGVRHTVAKNETLAGIAKAFGADAEDIASYNGLDAGEALVAGSELIIPGGEISAPVVKKPSVATIKKPTIKTGGSMGVVRSVGDTTHTEALSNPVPLGRLSQGIHGWNGVDFAAPAGTPVYAAASGTVILSRVGGWNGGYGNYIVIDHGDGTQTLYAHLSTDIVSVGQQVAGGQNIGTVGRTGKATGNHLHFEVRGAKNPFGE